MNAELRENLKPRYPLTNLLILAEVGDGHDAKRACSSVRRSMGTQLTGGSWWKQAVGWRQAGSLALAWWCLVRWWELRARLSAFQEQRSSGVWILGRLREQRAIQALLSALREFRRRVQSVERVGQQARPEWV